ncbi:hypothetical protein QOT17_012858 [Balamuthia mandrillaris]
MSQQSVEKKLDLPLDAIIKQNQQQQKRSKPKTNAKPKQMSGRQPISKKAGPAQRVPRGPVPQQNRAPRAAGHGFVQRSQPPATRRPLPHRPPPSSASSPASLDFKITIENPLATRRTAPKPNRPQASPAPKVQSVVVSQINRHLMSKPPISQRTNKANREKKVKVPAVQSPIDKRSSVARTAAKRVQPANNVTLNERFSAVTRKVTRPQQQQQRIVKPYQS